MFITRARSELHVNWQFGERVPIESTHVLGARPGMACLRGLLDYPLVLVHGASPRGRLA